MTGLGTRGRLGIVFALRQEESGLERILAESRSATYLKNGITAWQIGSLEVYAAVSGIGGEKSAQTTRMLIADGAQWILASGFAASLDPIANVGDIIVAEKIVSMEAGMGAYFSDKSLLAAIPPSQTNPDTRIHACDLVSVDTVVSSTRQKREIFLSTGAGALDMESYAAAKVCAEYGIPFASIRAVSDSAADSIPGSIVELLAIEGAFERIIYAAARPHIWRSILEMKKKADLAANNLADILGLVLLRLIQK